MHTKEMGQKSFLTYHAPLVLKHDIGVPGQALAWLPLGLVVEDEPSELS